MIDFINDTPALFPENRPHMPKAILQTIILSDIIFANTNGNWRSRHSQSLHYPCKSDGYVPVVLRRYLSLTITGRGSIVIQQGSPESNGINDNADL